MRFRHFDNDLVRAARQQDFLREARQKLPPEKLIEDRNELLDIFTEYTTSDIGDAVQLLELLKTFLAVQSAPVSEVHFPAELGTDLRDRQRRRDPGRRSSSSWRRGHARRAPGRRAPPPDEEPERRPAARTSRRRRQADEDEPKPDEEKPENDFVGPADGRLDREGQTYAKQIAGEEARRTATR